jgi:apolipoprotein N-acyltransferase
MQNWRAASMRYKIYALLALLAGTAMAMAFAPLNYFALAWVSPLILLYLCLQVPPRLASYYGWLFGLGFFTLGISWIYIAIHDYGHAHPVLAAILTLLLVLYCAAYIALTCYLVARFCRFNLWAAIIGFAAIWALAEYVRSYLLTGFPWLLLGYSQINSPLSGLIPILGDYGLSFYLLCMSGSVLALINKSSRLLASLALAVLASLAALSYHKTWTQPTPDNKPLRVALVQGNVPQHLLWLRETMTDIYQTYLQLTQPHWQTDLIIWPESAIPTTTSYAQPLLTQLHKLANANQTGLMLGITTRAAKSTGYYNTLLGLGAVHGHYYKYHLVPFGEYLPALPGLTRIINALTQFIPNTLAGSAKQMPLQFRNIQLAPFICYEVAYPDRFLANLPQAGLLISISNDAWYNRSFARIQHLQIAQFRALQTGRYFLFSTNDGITAIIQPDGQLQSTLPSWQTLTLTGTVQAMTGATPWVRIGNLPIILWLGLCLLGIGYWRRVATFTRRD